MALFRSDDSPMARSSAPAANPAEQHNIIGTSTVVEGTLRSSGNVNISGTVNGNVEVEGRTMVMPGGVIDGELSSTSAEVAGTVKGRVVVRERLVLKATAVIEGDIRTGKLVVEDGASFNGQCVMGQNATQDRAPAVGKAPRTELAEGERQRGGIAGGGGR